MIPTLPDLEETLHLLCDHVPYSHLQWRVPLPPLPLTSGCSRVSVIPHSHWCFQTTFYLHFSKSHHSFVIFQPPGTSSHPSRTLAPNSHSSTAHLCASGATLDQNGCPSNNEPLVACPHDFPHPVAFLPSHALSSPPPCTPHTALLELPHQTFSAAFSTLVAH